MKQIALNAEVHFHEQELVSIFHETNVSSSSEKFAEKLFAATFALRIMSNLGDSSAPTKALGQQLQLLAKIIEWQPEHLHVPKPLIVKYPGRMGRKRFVSRLRFTRTQLQLDFSAKGFGWFAAGVGYYGPAAANSVFRYFASRRLDDFVYLKELALTADTVGLLGRGGKSQTSNRAELEQTVVGICMLGNGPEWTE